MPQLVAIEPALFREDEAWFVFDDGKRYLRKRDQSASARREVNFPMIGRGDTIDPCCGADGKFYTSLSAYRATLKPDGNPKGERFIEMGDQELPPFKAPEFDRQSRRDAIKAGIQDVKEGRVAPLVTGDQLP